VRLNDIGRRIFGEHSRLIVALVVLGLAVGLLLQVTSGRMYTASARLVLDTQDPKSPSEAKAIADWAKGVATAPGQVRIALAHAKITDRRAAEIAKNHVSISSLGASAVLQLSVSDRDRDTAAKLTNALAERVIEARVAFSNGQLQQAVGELQQRIEKLNSQIAALDVQLDSLAVQLARVASTAEAGALRSQRDGLQQRRDVLLQQRNVAESELVSLLSAGATRPKPAIISRATIPTHSSGVHWLRNAFLGALLGLIAGIGTAAALETFRPTIAGSENLAEAFGTPLIAVLPSVYPGERRAAVEDLTPLGARLRLVGNAARAQEIGLVAADPSVDLTGLATQLVASRSALDGVEIQPVDLDEAELEGRRERAVVLVSPTSLKQAELLALDRRLSLTSATLLGLITYQGPHERHWPWSEARDRVAVVAPD
jgi:capsular polysaccharide biosynthesis protein